MKMEITSRDRYKANVMKLSTLMREQTEMNRPLEKAVEAIEHVIRYNGAPHLRPASCRLSMLQRESLDVAFILVLVLMAVCYLSLRIFISTSSKFLQYARPDPIKKNQ